MIVPKLVETDTTALDIGCEGGFLTAKLRDEGLSMTGIDIDQDWIKTAKHS